MVNHSHNICRWKQKMKLCFHQMQQRLPNLAEKSSKDSKTIFLIPMGVLSFKPRELWKKMVGVLSVQSEILQQTSGYPYVHLCGKPTCHTFVFDWQSHNLYRLHTHLLTHLFTRAHTHTHTHCLLVNSSTMHSCSITHFIEIVRHQYIYYLLSLVVHTLKSD